jgi:hypothetical protein
VLFALELRALHERMRFQKFAEPFAQGAGAVTSDDTYLRAVCEGRLIDEFIDLLARLFHGHPNHIDFAACAAFARLRAYCDVVSSG